MCYRARDVRVWKNEASAAAGLPWRGGPGGVALGGGGEGWVALAGGAGWYFGGICVFSARLGVGAGVALAGGAGALWVGEAGALGWAGERGGSWRVRRLAGVNAGRSTAGGGGSSRRG